MFENTGIWYASIPLYLLLKDHEQVRKGDLPKTCPVCSSPQGMKFQLSNIKSELLEPKAEASKNYVKALSSEVMLSSFDKLNAKLKSKLSHSGS